MNGIEATGMATVLPMLWVLGLMAAVVVSVVSKRRYERMSKRIGVEIELIKHSKLRNSPHEKMANWITKRIAQHDSLISDQSRKMLKRIRVDYQGYTHQVMMQTKLVTDSSLNNGGFEIVSPPLSGDKETQSWVQRIGSALRGVAGVDSSCSVHVHVGLQDFESGEYLTNFDHPEYDHRQLASAVVGRVGYAYGYFQTVLNKLVSPSRRNGRWSRDTTYMLSEHRDITEHTEEIRHWGEDDYPTVVTKTITDPWAIGLALYETLCRGGPNDPRYQCVNPLAFRKYGTIEFRSHQGSTNPTKIQNWIDIVHLLTSRCANESWTDITEYNGESFTDFMAYLGLSESDELFSAGVRRIRSLNGSDPSVFAHDPKIAHSALFKAIPVCSTCSKLTCDHDGECGSNHADLLSKEIYAHFDGGIQYPNRTCDDCCSDVQDSTIDREYSGHTNAHCYECDEETSFSAVGGLLLSVALGTIPLALLVVGCGIGAIHAVNKRFKHKKASASLFKALSARGKQASGFAFDNGGCVYYVKAPHSSHAMAHHMGKQLTRDTQWTMMHTRYATHGVNNKANAHPHFGRLAAVTMVHNGVVHNCESVWAALGEKPTGPVDSQAVAQCLEVGGVEKVVEHCEGSMSLIWSDNREPQGTLKCWTNGGNPLVMGRLDNATDGPVVVASTLALLKQGVGKRLKVDWNAVIGREYTIHPNGSITNRDIDGSEETAGVSYDWRTYKQTDYYSTTGRSGSDYTPIGRLLGNRKADRKVINLARDKMAKSPSGSFLPIEGKWDGYDGLTHEGIHASKWDDRGELLRYDLPQYLSPSIYEDDLTELLRGDHRQYTPSKWDLNTLDGY